MRWTIPAVAMAAAVSLPSTLPLPTPAVPTSGGAASGPAPATGPSQHSFAFTRAAYQGRGRGGWSVGGWSGGGRGGASWTTDYPKADRQFLVVLRRVTNLDAYPGEHAVRLDDPSLRRFPFLYAVEVGRMALSPEEVEGLRGYLLAGGFLVVDDFWGTRQWSVFEATMRRVLPDRPIVDLPRDHPVFRAYYRIDELVQVPAWSNARRGRTWEQDGYEPHARGIFADDGRLMVVINWNTDLGDAWEWAEQPDYPLDRSTFAYELGVNLIVHAMSH